MPAIRPAEIPTGRGRGPGHPARSRIDASSRPLGDGVGAVTYPPNMSTTPEVEAATDPSAVRSPCLALPLAGRDFMTCPLLYRFRVIDRLPSPPSPAATRGTLVHAVLERLFDLPAAERSRSGPARLVAPEWERLLEAEPELGRAVRRRRAGATSGSPPPSTCSTPTSRWRTPPASSPPSASCSSSPTSSPACGCAATSTGSMSRRMARCASSTTRPAGLPARASRPRRCSRCASTRWCCGGCTARSRAAPAALPRQRRGAALRARRGRPAGDRAQGRRRLGRRQAGHREPATGDRARRSCATGATTRRCARLGRHSTAAARAARADRPEGPAADERPSAHARDEVCSYPPVGVDDVTALLG